MPPCYLASSRQVTPQASLTPAITGRAKNATQEMEQHKAVAEATFKKDARINIRLSSRDLRSLQARALQEGIPYQTLVSSILHKYVHGRLVDKSANK
jgi:predicted DNA binding CopG/RHH family protein